MAIYYQPVGLPSAGGSSQAESQATSGISTGLNNLGDKITGLGTRRQKRIDEEQERKNKKGLQILELAAANMTDESELNELASKLGLLDGIVLDGSANVINTARERLLGDVGTRFENTRKGHEATEAGHDATKAGHLASDAGADSKFKANEADARERYAPRLAAVIPKAYTDPEGYAADMAAIARDVAETNPGVDITKLFSEVDGVANQGIKTRSAYSTELANKELDLTTIQTQPGIRSSTNSRNALSVYQDGETYRKSEAELAEEENTDFINRFVADLRLKGISNEANIQAVRNSDLPPEDKTRAMTMLMEPDSGVEKFNPIQDTNYVDSTDLDPLSPQEDAMNTFSNTFLGTNKPTNKTRQVPITESINGIVGATEAAMSGSPELRIYSKASGLENNEAFKDNLNDVGMIARQLYPELDMSDDKIRTMNLAQQRFPTLSNSDLVALVGEAVLQPFPGTGMMGNKPEMSNSKYLELAEGYAADKNNLVRVYKGYQDDLNSVQADGLRISNLQEEKKRALENGNMKVAREKENEISQITLRILDKDRKIQNKVANLRGKNKPLPITNSRDLNLPNLNSDQSSVRYEQKNSIGPFVKRPEEE